jgi:probable HAF family extracellular repeat protein
VSCGASHGFLYSNGQIVDLGKDTVGSALNDSGQITGNITTAVPSGPIYFRHAFLYSNGQVIDLHTLDVPDSLGFAINNAGEVTGMVGGYPSYHAFLYSDGQMRDLGTLGGLMASGNGINDSGQVVGTSDLPGPNTSRAAFLYSNGTMTNLNDLIDPTLGLTLFSASGINEHGQIVADGYSSLTSPGSHAFILDPASASVPEPSSVASVGFGLLVLAGVTGGRFIRS